MTPSTASYKHLKEEFVSGLTGGTVWEVAQVTAVAPVAVILWSVLQYRQSLFWPYTPLAFVVDFLVSVGAFLLAVTLYADTPALLNGLLLAAATFVCVLPAGRRRKPKLPPNPQPQPKTSPAQLDVLSMKPFLTTYRAFMLITTAAAILAVDFRVFPRRFAKVETWGTSLMDLGVGSFVFSAGVVASRSVLKARIAGHPTPLGPRLLASLRHSLPLLVLGLIRLLSVKGLDYAEHVSEYGVHWNFFFTLGLLPPFVALFQSALGVVPSYAGLALLLAALYQVALESTSLKAYILTAPRVDLLSENREGVFSFFGYLAIFLAGQHMGMYVLPRTLNPKSTSSPGVQRATLLLLMGMWCLVWTALYLLTTHMRFGAGLTVSRRLANLPYVLWVTAFNSVQVLVFCLIDTLFFPQFYHAHSTGARAERDAYLFATSPVMRAFNRNGLAVFLAANLLTGLVNLTVPTLDVAPAAAVGILVVYMGAVTGLAVWLDVYDVSIKL